MITLKRNRHPLVPNEDRMRALLGPIHSASTGDHPSAWGIEVRVEEVTFKRSEVLLATSPGNRNLRLQRVEKYGRDMLNGRWSLNGEPLIIDEDGGLRNGHHRCAASLKYRVSFRSVVVYGVSRDAFSTMDQGASRNTADVIIGVGGTNGRIASAVSVLLWKEEKGHSLRSTGTVPTAGESLDVLSRHADLSHSFKWRSKAGVVGIKPSVAVFVHYKLSRINKARADQFMSKLFTGVDLTAGDPILLLRNRLAGTRTTTEEQVALAFSAWNAWRSGRLQSRLQLRSDTIPTPK